MRDLSTLPEDEFNKLSNEELIEWLNADEPEEDISTWRLAPTYKDIEHSDLHADAEADSEETEIPVNPIPISGVQGPVGPTGDHPATPEELAAIGAEMEEWERKCIEEEKKNRLASYATTPFWQEDYSLRRDINGWYKFIGKYPPVGIFETIYIYTLRILIFLAIVFGILAIFIH